MTFVMTFSLKFAVRMLHADGNGFPVAIETFIRQTMRDFPFVELPAFQQFVTTIAATKIVSLID